MKKIRIIILILAGIAAGVACKSQYDILLNSNDMGQKYVAAMDYFNRGKYTKAAQLFESLAQITTGTERDDTVQYYWGLSNYRFKDFITAEANFTKYMENYPRGAFARDARFLRVDCLYRATLRYELDQTPTNMAIAAIGEYLAEYPDGSHVDACYKMLDELGARLDRKAYESAKLYYKMEDYKSSRVAFKNVLKDDADNIYREDILYYIAMSSYRYAHLSVPSQQRDRYLTFIDDYYNFIGEMPESGYRRELDVMYRRAQRALGRNVAIDDESDISDRQFERDARQMQKEQQEQFDRELTREGKNAADKREAKRLKKEAKKNETAAKKRK